MFTKIIRNDLKGSKLISFTIFSFILFASFLLSTVGIVAVNLSASVNLFAENAKAPHFLQMHMGNFDSESMLSFAQNNKHVQDYQTMPFLNVDASDILVNGIRFSENSQDNGFSYQSENFDFLLDLDNRIIYPKESEIYIPLVYYINGNLKIGDNITVSNRDFTVKGAIRDAQMSSMLSSSKRFLIHPNDYEKIKSIGREEFLIEFLLNDLSSINMFQADYSNANLESNGPTITYSIIRLMNALTDGIMIAILSLIAILIVIVSFLCIRLTLTAKIEDEYKTIGVLKAIGIRLSNIKKIYQAKYTLLSFLGCVFGLILSFVFSGFFLQNIRMFFGENGAALPAAISAIIGAMFIFLIVMFYISRFLNRLKKMSPASAINTGIVSDSASKLKYFKLRKQKLLSTDSFLGLNLILTRKKTYLTFVIILIIASFVMILPNNIYSSLASDKFITYMGLGNGQAMMILPGSDQLNDLDTYLKNDQDVGDYAIYDNKSYEFMLDDNTVSKMWLTLGNHDQFPVLYTTGHAPQHDNEIALSYLNASGLEKEIGDTLSLIINRQRIDLVITGIYSDITNGGKTARAAFSDAVTPSLSKSVLMNFKQDISVNEKIKSLEQVYPNAKVYHIESYRDAVFGSTLNSIRTSGITAIILSIGLTFLITLLFINMLVVKDRQNISILKSVGFTYKNLRKQYMTGSLLLVIVSMILGMLLVSTLGQAIAGSFIQTMGIANFKFDINKLFVLFIAPICMVTTVYIGTGLTTRSIKEMKLSDYIRG
ncbi:MAG TPA: FtsX-like permease family protein [Clostridiaceae bacterium]|nr:FtsX-like permease family protein [Clostridiaceae bacterium]